MNASSDPKVVGPLLVELDVDKLAKELDIPLDSLLTFQRAYVNPVFNQ
jgi:hypothetical protein